MPVFVLYLKAKLENVARVELPEDYHYDITLRDCASDETRDVIISAEESAQLSTGRGYAHFVMKWDKGSKVEYSVTVQHIKGLTRPLSNEDSEAFVPAVAFECRGVEPVAFRPGSGFVVESVMEDVDLSDLDWCDFDEGKNESVGIYEFESRFEVRRK